MKTLLTLLPALVAAAACAGVRVPMDVRANGMHLADGTVDGVPCRLLVDTGATHTTFDLAFVTNRLPAARLEDVKVFGETNVGFAPKCFSRAAFRLGGHAFPAQGAMAVPLDGPKEKCNFSLMYLLTKQEPLGLTFLLPSLILQDLKAFSRIDLTKA